MPSSDTWVECTLEIAHELTGDCNILTGLVQSGEWEKALIVGAEVMANIKTCWRLDDKVKDMLEEEDDERGRPDEHDFDEDDLPSHSPHKDWTGQDR